MNSTYRMDKKRPFRLFPKAIKSKYSWGDRVPASGIYECSVCDNLQAFQKGEFFSQCDECIKNHDQRENKWYVTNEFVYFMSKNMNLEFDKEASFGQRFANIITTIAGTMGFVYFHILWFGLWIVVNLGYFGPIHVFDPYPFGLLTMIVSLEAIFLATLIMISQNIQSEKSELRAEHEYQINLQAEKNVAEILTIVKELRKDEEITDEKIEELKETIEEIVPEELKPVEQVVVEDTAVPLEAVEHETFQEHKEILQEAGIDVMPESAPPIVQERKRKGRKKKVKDLILEGTEQTKVDINILSVPKELRREEKTPEPKQEEKKETKPEDKDIK
jgi:uncharacterized membrane protein